VKPTGWIALVLILIVPTLAVGQQAAPASGRPAETALQPDVVVAIDASAASKPYSRMLFGGFIEHFGRQIYGGLFEPGSPLSDENGFRTDVIEAMRELKLSVVRWPGGCFASGYHWKDGVGKDRRPVDDPVWGTPDPNTFGTDEFVAWCRLVGCEPYICTNAGNGTPEEMRQWVEYCNATEGEYADMRKANGHAEPHHVQYWSIGNENYGHWEIGRKSPAEWGPLVHQCAEQMRRVDPDINLAAAAWQAKRDWNLPLLAAVGRDLNYMAVHDYWLPLWGKHEIPPFQRCIGLSDGPEKAIAAVIEVLEEAGCRGKIKIAFDEWNLRGWHHPGFPRKQAVAPDDEEAAQLIAKRELNAVAAQYTMADALFAASFLNACLRHCDDVGMANIAPIVNTRGPLYVHPNGIVRRTHFHTLTMYANELEGRVAPLSLKAGSAGDQRKVDLLDAVATVDKSGRTWAIVLVNRHPSQHVACSINMKDLELDDTYKATVLAGDSTEAYNDIENPDRVVPEQTLLRIREGFVQLPPHSLTIIKVP